jgi:hypothetical protein
VDTLSIVWSWLVTLASETWALILWLWNNLVLVANYLVAVAQALWNGLRFVASNLWRGLQALAHLRFADIWNALKRGFDRLRRALEWYQKHITEPLDRIRRQIWGVYRTLFRPILVVLDQFRSMVRIVAIFDRRLAAKLDSKFLYLENKLMYPITALLRRVNEISSYTRALITASGLLDRVLTLETLRRDALLVWEVLTNPLGRIYAKPEPWAPRSLPEIFADFDTYMKTGGGPFAESESELDAAYREGKAAGG